MRKAHVCMYVCIFVYSPHNNTVMYLTNVDI